MSTPFLGQTFTFTQPDGTLLDVRGWGDQNAAVFETLHGYTVVEDPVTGFYTYADLTAQEDELRPTGVRPRMNLLRTLNLAPGLRVKDAARKGFASIRSGLPEGRWEERRREYRDSLRSLASAPGVAPAPPSRKTVGDYVGLCLLIDFPDVPGTITREEVDAFCNEAGYSNFGNRGSVRDYFLENSGGVLNYSTIVAPYYTAKHPRKHYTDPKVPYGQRTRELIKEALDHHVARGMDFSQLTVDNAENVYATNVFYAGRTVNNWSKGLWPHASRLIAPYPLTSGINAFDYQITSMGSELTLGTYCHENGHMLCDFPDLYSYEVDGAGTGYYCLMCFGGNLNPKNPAQVGAYLKYRAGWGGSVTQITDGLNAVAPAGQNTFFIHARNKREYFIVENRHQSGRDASLPDAGLAIWHIDELGDNTRPVPGSGGIPRLECRLVEADGRLDLVHGFNQGESTDLFHAGLNSTFGAATTPASNWHDGTSSGLELFNIGPAGTSVAFSARL